MFAAYDPTKTIWHFPPVWGMLRRSRRVQSFLGNNNFTEACSGGLDAFRFFFKQRPKVTTIGEPV